MAGSASRAASATIRLLLRKASGCTSSALARVPRSVSNAASISASLLAWTISIFSPSFCAASTASRTFRSVIGLRGLTRKPINVAAGTRSCKRPTCFAASPPNSEVTPVTLPPGRFKLATRPLATGVTVEGRDVVAISAVFRQQLVAENALHDRVAIVETIEIGDVEAPGDMILLGGVGQAFDPENKLIELDPVGVDRITGRQTTWVRQDIVVARAIGDDNP